MSRTAFLLIFVLAFTIAGCDRPRDVVVDGPRTESSESPQENGIESTPEAIRAVSGSTTILADGRIVAANPPLSLSFQTSGRLLSLSVAAGDKVAFGDLIAVLEDETLQDAVAAAQLALDQAETSLSQAQLSLDNLQNWEPDEMTVQVAEANLAAAQARLESVAAQDAASGNSLTGARVTLDQAQRALNDIQEAYDIAWDEGRDWELNYDEPICYPGQGGPTPCTGPTWKERIENERDSTSRGLIQAQEGLTVAQANYNLALAGLNSTSSQDAELAILNAEQSLNQATTGPREEEINSAELQVAQAELAVRQAEQALEQAEKSLDKANLFAPWSGTVISVETTPGALISPGTPIVTILDAEALEFHTTNLSERDLPHILPGQTVEITLKSYPNEPISGTVAYVLPMASGQVGDAATFTVVIDLDETELDLWPGMLGRVNIIRGE